MPDFDFSHFIQVASLANSFFAAVAATFAFFRSSSNGRAVQETKVKVERVELMINGHMTDRILAERTIARAEGVADALQAVAEAEKTLLKGERKI
jgi:hypothetical protein